MTQHERRFARRLTSAAVGLALVAVSCGGGSDSDSDSGDTSTSDSVEATTPPTTATEPAGTTPDSVPAGSADPAMGDSSVLFDDAALHTFDLTIADDALAVLDADPTAEEYVEGTLGFNGEPFGAVGVRHKGSIGSYIGCVDGPDPFNPSGAKTCTKISMKVKINWDDPKTEFFGQRRLILNSMNRDDSMLHERLGYWMFREMGIPASRSTHARVNLNGEFLGIFALTEQVDGRFTRANFDDGKGNLYKEIWPFWSDFNVSPEDAFRNGLRTNEDDPETTVDMITEFANELLNADPSERVAVLEQWTDLDALMRYSVVDRAIRHDDGPMHWYCNDQGCGNQNFYWYEETDAAKMRLIPWDLDGAFRNLTSPSEYTDIADDWGQITADCQPFAHGPLDNLQRSAACDPLIGTLATLDDAYAEIRAELLAGPLSVESTDARLETWIAQIEPLVVEAAETHGDAVPVETWLQSVDELRRALDITRNS